MKNLREEQNLKIIMAFFFKYSFFFNLHMFIFYTSIFNLPFHLMIIFLNNLVMGIILKVLYEKIELFMHDVKEINSFLLVVDLLFFISNSLLLYLENFFDLNDNLIVFEFLNLNLLVFLYYI